VKKGDGMKNLKMRKVLTLIFLLGAAGGCSQSPKISGLSTPAPASQGSGPTNGSPLQVQLAWNANKGEQQGFYVEQSSDGTNFTQVLSVPDGTYAATIPVSAAGNYYFRLRGYNQSGTSPYTAVISSTVN
jgi:hypothetical protein